MIYFVGAGSGAPDLITVRGARLIADADRVIYTGSLVNPELLRGVKEGCTLLDSARMTLEEVILAMQEQEQKGGITVRLHTGDPSIYGAIAEQMNELDRLGLPYEVVPGVSSFCAAAAALHAEYTLPGVSQTVILSRTEGRTPVPDREKIRALAAHQSTMVLFLSAGLAEKLQAELLEGGYPADTPAAVVYRASWPDEKTCRCTVGTLARSIREENISHHALILVGQFLDRWGERSCLYDPSFTTGYRGGKPFRGQEP